MSSDLPSLHRIVTGHTAQGISSIQSENQVTFTVAPLVPGASVAPLWKTNDGLPTGSNNTLDDGAKKEFDPQENFGMVARKGTNLQLTELSAGAVTPNHRTSSVDYNILLAGELVLVMEDGSETRLTGVGDSVIMKGGLHFWKNPASTTARWATVMIGADPVRYDSKDLAPVFE